MPSPPTPGLYLLGASPCGQGQAPLAFVGLAECPGISFFLPNPCGDLPKLLLQWRRWPCQQHTTHWPETCYEQKGGQEWQKTALPCQNFCLSFLPVWPGILRPYTLPGNNWGVWFSPLLFLFWFIEGESPRKTQNKPRTTHCMFSKAPVICWWLYFLIAHSSAACIFSHSIEWLFDGFDWLFWHRVGSNLSWAPQRRQNQTWIIIIINLHNMWKFPKSFHMHLPRSILKHQVT